MLLGGNNELIDHQEYKYVWGKDEDRDCMYNIITRNVYSMFVFFLKGSTGWQWVGGVLTFSD